MRDPQRTSPTAKMPVRLAASGWAKVWAKSWVDTDRPNRSQVIQSRDRIYIFTRIPVPKLVRVVSRRLCAPNTVPYERCRRGRTSSASRSASTAPSTSTAAHASNAATRSSNRLSDVPDRSHPVQVIAEGILLFTIRVASASGCRDEFGQNGGSSSSWYGTRAAMACSQRSCSAAYART